MDLFQRVESGSYEEWYRSPVGRRINAEERGALARVLGRGKGRLLEVGCGTGNFTGWFAELGYTTTGVDNCWKMIRYAKDRCEIPFAVADGSFLPFGDNSFDIAVAVTALEFSRHPDCVIREMERVSNGTIVLLMLNPCAGLNRKRREKGTGVWAAARFWQPEKTVLLLKDLFPWLGARSIYQEVHEDFYILLLDRNKGQ